MGLTKSVQNDTLDPAQKSLELKQQSDALRKNLTTDDQENICKDHSISRATYFRKIHQLDLADPITQAIVALAAANKEAGEQRVKEANAMLKKLL
ncbi:hypothetical protein GCM10027346_21030 [Hymenobacter seoulensis]